MSKPVLRLHLIIYQFTEVLLKYLLCLVSAENNINITV